MAMGEVGTPHGLAVVFRRGMTDGTGKTSTTYSLHRSSFLGLPFRILNIELVKPKKGTTMETRGTTRRTGEASRNHWWRSSPHTCARAVQRAHHTRPYRSRVARELHNGTSTVHDRDFMGEDDEGQSDGDPKPHGGGFRVQGLSILHR